MKFHKTCGVPFFGTGSRNFSQRINSNKRSFHLGTGNGKKGISLGNPRCAASVREKGHTQASFSLVFSSPSFFLRGGDDGILLAVKKPGIGAVAARNGTS